ncbi:hypothetical protein Plhal304r1_c004g0018101 [Plasmopara halstedii]
MRLRLLLVSITALLLTVAGYASANFELKRMRALREAFNTIDATNHKLTARALPTFTQNGNELFGSHKVSRRRLNEDTQPEVRVEHEFHFSLSHFLEMISVIVVSGVLIHLILRCL